VPGIGLNIPLWILGSSLFGAQVAAALGLPFAFASHFAPTQMMDALEVYRASFRPSSQLGEPYVMLGFNVFAADTDEEAQILATSMQQAFVNLRSGRPSRLQPPIPGYRERLGAAEQALLQQVLSCSAIGSPATVRSDIERFIARTGANELMINSNIYEHFARLRSFEITAEVRTQIGAS
jgi:luciferase family oxidoreductase group 1